MSGGKPSAAAIEAAEASLSFARCFASTLASTACMNASFSFGLATFEGSGVVRRKLSSSSAPRCRTRYGGWRCSMTRLLLVHRLLNRL